MERVEAGVEKTIEVGFEQRSKEKPVQFQLKEPALALPPWDLPFAVVTLLLVLQLVLQSWEVR